MKLIEPVFGEDAVDLLLPQPRRVVPEYVEQRVVLRRRQRQFEHVGR